MVWLFIWSLSSFSYHQFFELKYAILNDQSTVYLQFRSRHPEVFLEKGILKIYSKFTGEHSCWSAISIKLLCNFIEIALRHGCSPVNLLHIFRTPFVKNTSGWLLLQFGTCWIASNRVTIRNTLNIDKHLSLNVERCL